ncbi:MAG: PAS domain S-box protein [candidate division NC10 bacterium]|nr:PAS domain S-box protein [candidate division NC10 bacterium]
MAVSPRLTPEEAQHRLAALLSRLEGTDAGAALQEAKHLIADLTDSIVSDITDRKRAEQELVKTRALLQAAVAQSPSGILIADAPDVTIRYANEAALRIRGDADQPLTGISVDRHSAAWNVFLTDGITPCPPEDLPLSRAILKGETSRNTELIIRRSSGEDRWVSANASPVKDADGRIVGGLVIFHDVTENRRAEDALRNSEATLRSLFRAVPVGLVILKDRVILTANDRLAEMFGYGPGEMIGQPTRVLYPSDEGYRRAGQTLYEIPGERGTTFAESRMVRKDGSVREISLNATPLDPDDPSAGIAVTLLDITERKQAEQALRDSEAALRSLFHATPIGIAIMKDRIFRAVNARHCDQVGYSEEELINVSSRMLYASEAEFERVGHALYGQLREGSLAVVDTVIRRKDGALRDFRLTAALLQPENPSAGAAIASEDITDRKRAAAERERLQAELLQSQKMEMVGRLAGGIAHDLNNLLTPILGYAELALTKLAPADAKRLGVHDIEEAAKRARDLTHQLLAFSRKQPMELRPVSLTEMVAQFEKILQRTIREDIRLTSRLAPALGAVRADRAQLQQVLLNLVVNANDAMPSGGTLTITTDEVVCSAADVAGLVDVAPGPCVRLIVQDTGCGMDEEVQRHIFEPFYTTKPEGKGTGLGLATCYGIVRQHGGFFQVQSTPGQGSRFAVYLPRVAQETPAGAPTDLGRVTAGHETVLFTDDARTVRTLLQNILQSLGYDAIEAATPEAAIQVAREHASPIHLLITDVIMSGMNGRQLYEAVRAIRPEIKALYISGYTDDIIAPHGVLDPGIHFLAKPFTLAALSEKIREALGDGA